MLHNMRQCNLKSIHKRNSLILVVSEIIRFHATLTIRAFFMYLRNCHMYLTCRDTPSAGKICTLNTSSGNIRAMPELSCTRRVYIYIAENAGFRYRHSTHKLQRLATSGGSQLTNLWRFANLGSQLANLWRFATYEPLEVRKLVCLMIALQQQ